MEKSTICRRFSCKNHGFSTSMSVWVNPSFYVHPFHVDRPVEPAKLLCHSSCKVSSVAFPAVSSVPTSFTTSSMLRPQRQSQTMWSSASSKVLVKSCGGKKGGHTCRKMTCFRAYVFFGPFHRLIRLIYHNPYQFI